MKQISLLFLGLQLILSPLYSQEVTHEDYKRAVSFLHDNHNNKTVFNLKTKINWFKDGTGLWFIDYSKNKKTYKLVDSHPQKVPMNDPLELREHSKVDRKDRGLPVYCLAYSSI